MVPGTEDGISVGDYIGQLLGDAPFSDAVQETGDAEGTPPAERPPESTEPATPPEGTDAAERPGTPPVDAAAPAPDAPVAPVAEPDPLATATSLTYTVNGEQRTYDGIKVLGTDGAIVDAASLPDLIRKLGERDHLFDTSQAQYRNLQQFERLAEWRTTGADGAETVHQGQRGIFELRLDHARLFAENAALDAVLSDANKLAELVLVAEDGTYSINQQALRNVALEAREAIRVAEGSTREKIAALVAPATKPATLDVASHAPSIIQQIAGTQASTLTNADAAYLTELLPRFIRPATEQDRAQNPALRVGQSIVDLSYTKVVTDRVAIRSEQAKTSLAAKAEQTKLAASLTEAAARNAAALTAANRGAPITPAAPPAAPKPEPTTSDDLWDFQMGLASAPRARAG